MPGRGSPPVRNSLPVVVSGDCNSCLGTLSGLGSSSIGIIWFDAHGDMNTPETSPSGFFDGMSISIALGDCYSGVWSQLGNTNCVPRRMSCSSPQGISIPGAAAHRALTGPDDSAGRNGNRACAKLDALAERVSEVYLHFDLDALDPEFAPGAGFRCPDGISLAQALEAIAMIGDRFRIRAAALTNYNPDYEVDAARSARDGNCIGR